MRICHIDCDIRGAATISNLVREGWVQTFKCPTFKDAEGVLWGLYRKQIQADLVVVDTATANVQHTRQDIVMDYHQAKSLNIWDNRERLIAGRQDYYKTADVINRFHRPLRELDIPSIFICHERTTRGMEGRQDPLSGLDKFVPNLQREINEDLFTNADAIVRLHPSPYPFEYNGAQVAIGTRLLVLSPTGDSAAGVRVPADKPAPPPFLIVGENDPYSFSRFVQAVGDVIPHNTVLYGPPKIGKTRWVGTAAYHQV